MAVWANGNGPNYRCSVLRWSVDAKPFWYTWQINPDGSGHINDLEPAGLDGDPMLLKTQRGRRVFKTYQFDILFS